MFEWFHKKKHSLVASGLLNGMTDIHSHILPGVDDGSPDTETSLQLLAYMEELGFRKVWLTPHVMEDFPNSTQGLEENFHSLLNAYNGPLELALASEYMLDAGFPSRLPRQVLPLGKRHLLVETSYMYGPSGLHDILFNVCNHGFQPVIAHPERYMYMSEADYRRLKEQGYSLQLNLMSLSGYYGKRPQLVSEDLLAKGWYDFVGSDLHHLHRYQPMLAALKLKKEQLDALGKLIENNRSI
ncbi:MAG: hypothetical protein IJ456_03020 [Bacteroides sp.]|nr:hypothetical protein [Bacteroides sp.]